MLFDAILQTVCWKTDARVNNMRHQTTVTLVLHLVSVSVLAVRGAEGTSHSSTQPHHTDRHTAHHTKHTQRFSLTDMMSWVISHKEMKLGCAFFCITLSCINIHHPPCITQKHGKLQKYFQLCVGNSFQGGAPHCHLQRNNRRT